MAWHDMHERFPKHIFQVGLVWRNNHSVWVVATEQGIDGRYQSCARVSQSATRGCPKHRGSCRDALPRCALRGVSRCALRGMPRAEAHSRYTRSSGRTGSRGRCCCHAVASGPRARAGRSHSSSSIACTQTRAAITRALRSHGGQASVQRPCDWLGSSIAVLAAAVPAPCQRALL